MTRCLRPNITDLGKSEFTTFQLSPTTGDLSPRLSVAVNNSVSFTSSLYLMLNKTHKSTFVHSWISLFVRYYSISLSFTSTNLRGLLVQKVTAYRGRGFDYLTNEADSYIILRHAR